MTTGPLTRKTAPRSNVLVFERDGKRGDADYDRALIAQETQLREALSRIQALRRRHEEAQPVGGGVVRALFDARKVAASRIATLTSRQREILELVLAGRPSKIIAWELGISPRTVENHRATIMQRTGSKSVPALARLAIAAAWDGPGVPSLQPLSGLAAATIRNVRTVP